MKKMFTLRMLVYILLNSRCTVDKSNNYSTALSVAVISSSLILSTTVINGGMNIYTMAQDQQQNPQTNNISSTQSTGGIVNGEEARTSPNSLDNLTRQDLDPMLNNLFSAREELLTENITSAFDSLNKAGSELFKLIYENQVGNSKETTEKLNKLQRSIESARDALQGNNSTRALLHLNAADTYFIELALELSGTSDKATFEEARGKEDLPAKE